MSELRCCCHLEGWTSPLQGTALTLPPLRPVTYTFYLNKHIPGPSLVNWDMLCCTSAISANSLMLQLQAYHPLQQAT